MNKLIENRVNEQLTKLLLQEQKQVPQDPPFISEDDEPNPVANSAVTIQDVKKN